MITAGHIPKLSVVIPTCDRPDLLTIAVDSVPDIVDEIVIINDGNIDIPSDILLGNRIRVVKSGPRAGPASARNAGVLQASGEILFFLDDDDQFCSGYISRVMSVYGSGKSIDCGFSAVMESANGSCRRIKRKFKKSSVLRGGRPRQVVHALSAGFWIKRKSLFEVGCFDDNLRIDEDTDLCLRIYKARLKVWYDAEPGVIFRVTSDNDEAKKISEQSILSDVGYRNYLQTYNKHFLTSHRIMKFYLLERVIRRGMKDCGEIDEGIFSNLNIFWRLVASMIYLKYRLRRV